MGRIYELWIGNRYVRSRSSNSFVSLISAISMLGIAIAVAVLIVVLSVVNGFERELQEKLLTMTAHASIEGIDGELDDWPAMAATAAENSQVRTTAPYVSGQSLLVFGEQLSGAELRGIDPVAESAVSNIDKVLTHQLCLYSEVRIPKTNPPSSLQNDKTTTKPHRHRNRPAASGRETA